MDLATQRVPTTGLPWRQVGVLALIAILLAVAVGAYVGSQRRSPAPFGLASNGVVAYDDGGYLYVHDPADGTTTALTSTPDDWEAPWFSPDGTQLVMARELSPTQVEFGVIPVTGGEVTVVTPEPLQALGWIDFSPDSRSLIVDSVVDSRKAISRIDLDTGEMRTFDIGLPAFRPTYRPPDGHQILFAGERGTSGLDIMLMDADGSNIRTLFESTDDARAFDFPRFSPDGTRVAFSVWDSGDEVARLHVMAADGSGLRVLADEPGVTFTGWPLWSPDGTRIAVERTLSDGVLRVAFVDPDDGSVVVSDLAVPNGLNGKEWAPDGTALLATPNAAGDQLLPQMLVDPVTGSVTAAPWGARSYPSWQRTAD